MQAKIYVVLAVLVAVVFAGCTGNGGTKDTPEDECDDHAALCDEQQYLQDHYCIRNNARPRDVAPDAAGNPWVLGDWWQYSLKVGDGPETTTKLVYYADQDFDGLGNPQHYMAGTPTREEALQHAILSVNPMIGRIHRILYSPHESGEHADMFNFPVCQGNTWKTVFFGETFDYRVEQTTLQIPGMGSKPGWRMIGESAGGSRIVHTYSPDVKWFTQIDLDRADGSTVDMRLTGVGSGYRGEAFFLRGQQDHVEDLNGFAGSRDIPVPRSDGRSGPYNTLGIQMDLQRTGGSGQASVQFVDPSGTVRASAQVGGVEGQTTANVMVEVPYQPGEWTLQLRNLVPGTTVAGSFTVVSIYDRSDSV